MLRIQATIGATTYYFASEALDYANRYWEPRISNAFQISREFNSADKTGNKIRSVDVSLDNRDGFFNSIYTTSGLVNGKFVLYFNEGDNVVKTFTGRVNKINSFGDDISLTLREVGYEYLTRKFPDAQIAYDYYSSSGINDSWNAIPIHLGTVNRYPCPWVNLFESHFIIGSGPIHAVKKIYFDKTVVYDSSTGQNGYKPTPDSPEIKFRIFKGTRAGNTDIVEGVTSSYPGFAYIQLYKIVDAVEQPADPVNPDGEAVQIYVDIEGLQNEAGNAAERNPAQILYQFFTKPYTAEEGYGLAVDSGDLDFASAITECAIQGFKIDGSIDNTTDFGEWVDEILRCCRGQLYENNGKISVRIDAAAASPTIHFDETGELGYYCNVDTWNEPERDAQTNRVKLSYSWNFENSNFNKKPSYNQESPLGDTHLQNATHAARIQKWNTETLEYKLIKDDTTAHKLAQYYLNNIVKQLITTSLTTEVDIPNTVDAGTVVKVTSPKFGWNQKLFRITNISRAEENTEIQLKEYDASIFTFYNPGTGAETSGSQYSVYNIPAKPKLTSLSVVNELLADGSTQTRINVNFVAPTENSQLVALYYKPSGSTEADFKPLDTVLSSAGTMSAIWKGIESGNYNFRLVTISPVGIYSDLSIASGDKHYYGQPGSQGTVALTGDTIAPGKPSIDDFLLVQGAVTLHFNIPTGFPSDFSHFAVYRKLNGGSLLPLDMKYTGRLFTDTDTAGYVSRQYSIVAYDKSNNPSESSDLSVAMTPLKVLSDDITDQPIIGKCFLTGTLVGVGNPGIRFDCTGIYGYSATNCTFCINAATGDVSMTGTITALAGNIGGFTIDPIEGLHAGCTTTRVQMKSGAGFWAGATAQADAPFSVTQAGVLKSTSGTIGGFSIGTNILCSTPAAGCSVGMSACNTSGAVAFWAGCSTIASAPFRVTNTGAITACSGTIGGWSLAAASLSATNAYLYSGAANTARLEMGTGATSAGINSANAGTDISFWAGSTFANRASAPFNVTAAGALTATSGTIGGWTVGVTFLCANSCVGGSICLSNAIDNTSIQMFRCNTNSCFGTISLGNVLRLSTGWCCNAFHGMSIISNNSQQAFYAMTRLSDNVFFGQIAGWNFNASQLYSTGCGLILCNTGAIQTGDFVTSNKGWKIDSVGNAEFNNICARGAIRTAVFIKDEISVVGGCVMIRPADIWDDTNALSATSASYWLKCTDEFAVNDLIRVKDGVNDYWGHVTAKGVTGGKPFITATFKSGVCNWTPTKGQAVVNYGSCLGCGGIMLNGQCPYIDLYTHCGLPWTGLESRVRIGNLAGWGTFDTLCPTYGIAAGCPTGQYMTYDSVSGVLDIAGNINVKSTLPLSMPAGAVLELSAKGSTTATIALAGGVKDISGNSNHGQAFGGVTVVDSEVGKVFSFNGTDTRISTNILPSTLASGAFTIRFMIKTAEADRAVLMGNYGYSGVVENSFNLEILANGLLRFYGSWKTPTDQTVSATVFNTGEFIDLVFIFNGSDKFLVYKNGVLDKETTATIIGTPHATALQLGRDARTGVTAFGGLMAAPKIYNRALTAAEVKTLYMLGNQQESGVITADRVQTGVLSSLNWGSTTGSCFNMNDGTFTLGGSSAPKLSWNGTTLNVVGNVTITGGSGIANFTDAGALATVDNLDGVADGSTYKRTTQNEKTGAGRAYSGLDSSNRLTTAVIPGTAVTPSSAGLYLGSNNMGYHNGTEWRTYMGSNGNFYLGGTGANKGLAWDALNNCLTVCGCITSCAGNIGGWNITPTNIYCQNSDCSFISIGDLPGSSTTIYPGSIYIGAKKDESACGWISIGNYIRLASAWTNAISGISIISKGAVQMFRATYDRGTGCNFCGILAGWDFDCRMLKTGTFGSGVSFVMSKENTGSGYFYLGCQILQGYSMIYHYGNNAGHLVMGQIAANSTTIKTGYYGIQMMDHSGNEFFALAAKQGTDCYERYNRIAGWNFNAACLYSGNLIMNSSGAIQGNYCGDTSGWCIDAAGNAKFNNALIRGTVCASQGKVGCFDLSNGCLMATMTTEAAASIKLLYTNCRSYLSPRGLSVEQGSELLPDYVSYYVGGGVVNIRYTTYGTMTYSNMSATTMAFRYYIDINQTQGCSFLCYDVSLNGSLATSAPFKLCTYGGVACFAICTNGRIQASYFVGTASYAQYLCIHSSNEVTLACGYAGGALYVNYRGTTGAITCYIFGTGMCSGLGGLCSGNIGVSGNVYASTCLCSPIICGTSCVSAPYILSSGRIEASRLGFVGRYNSSETQGIWGISSSYMPDATITGFGTLYGMGYSYSTIGGGYFTSHHQVHWVQNGTVNASMSLSGYLWVRNYIISTCILGTTCASAPIVCGTTCVCAPVVCASLVCGCTPGSIAVRGEAACYCGVYGIAGCYGVYGQGQTCYGVGGYSVYYGVYGYATTSYGVYGTAGTSYPVAGNGAYYNTSTRTLKQNFEDVYVLPGLRTMCIQKWTWADANQRGFDEFITPVAEEVQKAWGLTFNDDGYYTLDGIALKAAQEIDENVQVIDQSVQVHESCISYLKDRNVVLESCIEQMSCKLKLIEERLGLN